MNQIGDLERNLIYFTRMPVQEDLDVGTDELLVCCGQFLASDRDHEHWLCDGEEDSYRVGGLAIEMEGCPHRGCGARFSSSPAQNLQHQDTIHRAILARVCATCQGVHISEGAFIRHVIHGHKGPASFEQDMN